MRRVPDAELERPPGASQAMRSTAGPNNIVCEHGGRRVVVRGGDVLAEISVVAHRRAEATGTGRVLPPISAAPSSARGHPNSAKSNMQGYR
jgi:hypothetical protein